MGLVPKTLAWTLAAASWACIGVPETAADDTSAKPKVTYQDDLTAVFRESCFGCHNADKAKGGLNLATFSSMMAGGSSGTAIEPGDPDNSYLYLLVTHQSEPHMPLNSPKLPEAKLAIIRRFIEDGALERIGSKPQAKTEHSELKLSSVPTAQPDGPPPMPPRLPLEPVMHTARATAITALAVSPWAPLAAVAGQQQVLLYNTDSMQLIGVLPFPEGVPHVLRFSRNGKLLLAGGGHEAKSGRVVLWDVATGKRVTEIGDEFDVVLAADISPDQSLVALGGPSKVVRIFSTATGELVNQIKKHTDWITALSFSPDNVLLATGDRNGEVLVWEAAKAREYLTLHAHTGAITALSWRADGNSVASASDDGSIRLWELENGKQTKTWNAHGGVQWVEYCRDGRLLTCGRDRQVKLWAADGKQQGKDMLLADSALRAAATGDAGRIIAGDWTGEVRVWNSADGKQLGTLSANPQKLDDLLAAAKKQLAAKQAEGAQLAKAGAGSAFQAERSVVVLASTQKSLDAGSAAEEKMKAKLSQLQKSVEQATAEAGNLKSELASQESAAAELAEAIAKAQQAAEKLPADPEISQALEKLKSSLEGISAKVVSTRKSLEENTKELAAAQEKLAEATKATDKLAADSGSARHEIDALSRAAKAAAEKASADKQAADRAASAAAGAQAEVDRWAAEIEFAHSAEGSDAGK
jgi:hypothetical protein